jgi:hypothetical protein
MGDAVEKLKEVIKKNGFIYQQVRRTRFVALYQQEDIGYEVFVIKRRKENEAFGKKYPEAEMFPSNEDFGKYAWTLRDRQKAEEKYNWLCENLRHKFKPSLFNIEEHYKDEKNIEAVV